MTKSGQTDRSPTTCGPEVDSPEAVAERSGSRRLLYLLLAALFFALGLIGIFLPLLPTTPLMLLTSYFLGSLVPTTQ